MQSTMARRSDASTRRSQQLDSLAAQTSSPTYAKAFSAPISSRIGGEQAALDQHQAHTRIARLKQVRAQEAAHAHKSAVAYRERAACSKAKALAQAEAQWSAERDEREAALEQKIALAKSRIGEGQSAAREAEHRWRAQTEAQFALYTSEQSQAAERHREALGEKREAAAMRMQRQTDRARWRQKVKAQEGARAHAAVEAAKAAEVTERTAPPSPPRGRDMENGIVIDFTKSRLAHGVVAAPAAAPPAAAARLQMGGAQMQAARGEDARAAARELSIATQQRQLAAERSQHLQEAEATSRGDAALAKIREQASANRARAAAIEAESTTRIAKQRAFEAGLQVNAKSGAHGSVLSPRSAEIRARTLAKPTKVYERSADAMLNSAPVAEVAGTQEVNARSMFDVAPPRQQQLPAAASEAAAPYGGGSLQSVVAIRAAKSLPYQSSEATGLATVRVGNQHPDYGEPAAAAASEHVADIYETVQKRNDDERARQLSLVAQSWSPQARALVRSPSHQQQQQQQAHAGERSAVKSAFSPAGSPVKSPAQHSSKLVAPSPATLRALRVKRFEAERDSVEVRSTFSPPPSDEQEQEEQGEQGEQEEQEEAPRSFRSPLGSLQSALAEQSPIKAPSSSRAMLMQARERSLEQSVGKLSFSSSSDDSDIEIELTPFKQPPSRHESSGFARFVDGAQRSPGGGGANSSFGAFVDTANVTCDHDKTNSAHSSYTSVDLSRAVQQQQSGMSPAALDILHSYASPAKSAASETSSYNVLPAHASPVRSDHSPSFSLERPEDFSPRTEKLVRVFPGALEGPYSSSDDDEEGMEGILFAPRPVSDQGSEPIADLEEIVQQPSPNLLDTAAVLPELQRLSAAAQHDLDAARREFETAEAQAESARNKVRTLELSTYSEHDSEYPAADEEEEEAAANEATVQEVVGTAESERAAAAAAFAACAVASATSLQGIGGLAAEQHGVVVEAGAAIISRLRDSMEQWQPGAADHSTFDSRYEDSPAGDNCVGGSPAKARRKAARQGATGLGLSFDNVREAAAQAAKLPRPSLSATDQLDAMLSTALAAAPALPSPLSSPDKSVSRLALAVGEGASFRDSTTSTATTRSIAALSQYALSESEIGSELGAGDAPVEELEEYEAVMAQQFQSAATTRAQHPLDLDGGGCGAAATPGSRLRQRVEQREAKSASLQALHDSLDRLETMGLSPSVRGETSRADLEEVIGSPRRQDAAAAKALKASSSADDRLGKAINSVLSDLDLNSAARSELQRRKQLSAEDGAGAGAGAATAKPRATPQGEEFRRKERERRRKGQMKKPVFHRRGRGAREVRAAELARKSNRSQPKQPFRRL